MPCTEPLKVENTADIEAIQIPEATRGKNNKNIYFTRYAPVTPWTLKKIVEYNSYTPQEIAVSFVDALKSFKLTQSVITTLTDAPTTVSPEAQPNALPTQNMSGAMKIKEEQEVEQTEVEVENTAENKIITQEGLLGNRKDETQ